MVSRCATCQENGNSNDKQRLIPHEMPDCPWAKVGVYLFHISKMPVTSFVSIITRNFQVTKLPSLKSSAIVTALSTSLHVMEYQMMFFPTMVHNFWALNLTISLRSGNFSILHQVLVILNQMDKLKELFKLCKTS